MGFFPFFPLFLSRLRTSPLAMDMTDALPLTSAARFRVVDPVLLDEQLKTDGETLAPVDPSFIRSDIIDVTTNMAEEADPLKWYTALSMCAPTGRYTVK